MRANTHARLMKIFNWAMLIVGVPVLLYLGFASFSGDIVPVLLFMAVLLVLFLLLWFLPVRCSAPGCNGSMHKTSTQISTFKVRLQYRYSICGDVYDADIFQMPPGDPTP